jgi:hypothetical protein
MSQYEMDDSAANSVIWAAAQFKKTSNSANRDSLYNNTTPDAFITGVTVGMFAVDATEIGVTNGSIVSYTITSTGTGYGANAAVTVSGNATSNALANTQGKIQTVFANTVGSGYTGTKPTVTIAAPASINIVANTTGFSNTDDTFLITSANSRFVVGDRIYYAVPTNNTAIAPLTGNNFYFVSFANTTTIKISTTVGGANIDLTDTRNPSSAETHTVTGDTATAEAVLSYTGKAVAHTGWNIRTVGSGGRAGRVQYETLVAGGITTDGEDTIFKDS